MNEKTIDQIEEEVLSYKVSDEAVEAAGTRTEIAERGRGFALALGATTWKTPGLRKAGA